MQSEYKYICIHSVSLSLCLCQCLSFSLPSSFRSRRVSPACPPARGRPGRGRVRGPSATHPPRVDDLPRVAQSHEEEADDLEGVRRRREQYETVEPDSRSPLRPQPPGPRRGAGAGGVRAGRCSAWPYLCPRLAYSRSI